MTPAPSGFYTRDPGVLDLLKVAQRAARSQASLFVTGESGTGKTRLARLLHEWSPRSGFPFVEVHCANLPAELVESDLFGHEQGAFTGAVATRPGRFEQAHRGSLFLDEIQDLDPALQAKVLRAVESGRFERVGGTATLQVDVRIIASTRESPESLMAQARLREDLFYRLDVVRLHLPPLRERPDDVIPLAESFLADSAARHRLAVRRFAPEAEDRLRRYPWPGNVRELKHAVESAAILASGEAVGPEDLPAFLSVAGADMLRRAAADGVTLRDLERAYVDEVLRRTRGNKSAAARILGISRKTLHDRLRAREAGGAR